MVDYTIALQFCKKPIVAVVRGKALGFQFTTLANVHFLYVAPDAKFKTPFVESGQSPEGASTLMFPQEIGSKYANKLLLCDEWFTA